MYILCVYAIMAPAHESETIVFNFRKLLSTLPNYAELEQILLFSVNWGKQVCWRTYFKSFFSKFSSSILKSSELMISEGRSDIISTAFLLQAVLKSVVLVFAHLSHVYGPIHHLELY